MRGGMPDGSDILSPVPIPNRRPNAARPFVNEHRYIARGTKLAARRIGDETMIMSGLDSSLFSLNPTASILWEAADGVTPLAQIVQQHICAQFEVSPEQALR